MIEASQLGGATSSTASPDISLLDQPPDASLERASADARAVDTESRRLPKRPALGFLGVGWIGLNRLQAIAKSGAADIVAVADSSKEMTDRARAAVPAATVTNSLEDLLDADLDGLVIATPSALHAEQAAAALRHGVAVFCQKPLGRDARETQLVIDAARDTDRLLGVDLSYRFMSGMRRIRELIQAGELGEVYAIEMAFHNAYGPDKEWFYDRRLSGGGCVIDLGIHLVDLALWMLAFPEVTHVASKLASRGRPWIQASETVEDYASAQICLTSGATVQLSCSWKLPAGRDAIIEGAFYGTRGGAAFRNVNGSFYEFISERFRGTSHEVLSSGPEEWGGRAAIDWARRLAESPRFDSGIETLGQVARILDAVYARSGSENRGGQ